MAEPEVGILGKAPFDDWTYEDAKREVDNSYDRPTYAIQKAYAVDVDHYRKGQEWIGPGSAEPTTGSIHNQFAPEDVIGELLSNVSNAFGEPQLGCVPKVEPAGNAKVSDATQRAMDEVVGFLSNWWDRERMQSHIMERQYTGAWAGVAAFRLWIPWRFLVKNQQSGGITFRPTDSIEKALSYIKVSAPLPEYATIYTDPGTQDKCAIYLDEEVTYVDNSKRTFKRAELIYLDPEREEDETAVTRYRVVYSNTEKPPMSAELNLGGLLLLTEMEVKSLLTDPVIRTQRQLNLLTTLITRIGETAAFRERYLINAKPQGVRTPYTEGDDILDGAFLERDEEGRLWQVVPSARTLGAHTTTELIGLPEYDDNGDAKGQSTPGVTIVDPVDPKPYNEAADATRRRILRMSGQGHLGGISNAEASGIAYEQARAVFEKDLNKRRVAEEGALRDLLTAALALAEAIAGSPGQYTNEFRITVDQHINPGPRSPDLVRLDLEAHEAGIMSRETAMARIGTEDLEAEELRINQSTDHSLSILEKMQPYGSTLTAESFRALLIALGVPAEIANTVDTAPPPAPIVSPTPSDEN
jgi:hypothetical protein